MNRLLATLKTIPTPQLVFLGVGILAVLAMVGGGVGTWVSKYKDKKFDKEIQTLKTERQALIDKANAAETHAKELEAEKVKYQVALEVAGTRAQAALSKVSEAEKRYDEEISNINSDTDICTRLADLRARLKLPPAPCKSE